MAQVLDGSMDYFTVFHPYKGRVFGYVPDTKYSEKTQLTNSRSLRSLPWVHILVSPSETKGLPTPPHKGETNGGS